MQYTENYNLAKPDGTDKVEISVLNENMTHIDEILADIYSKLPTPPQPGMTINISEASSSTEIPGQGMLYTFDKSLGLTGSIDASANKYEVTINNDNTSFTDTLAVIPMQAVGGDVVMAMYQRNTPIFSFIDNGTVDNQGQPTYAEGESALMVFEGTSLDSISFTAVDSTIGIHSYVSSTGGLVSNDNTYAYVSHSNIVDDYFTAGVQYEITPYWNGQKQETVNVTVVDEEIGGYTYQVIHSANDTFDFVYGGYYDAEDGQIHRGESGTLGIRIKCVDDGTVLPVTLNCYTTDVNN